MLLFRFMRAEDDNALQPPSPRSVGERTVQTCPPRGCLPTARTGYANYVMSNNRLTLPAYAIAQGIGGV